MNKVTNAAIFFLAAGILTSVSILSAYQILFAIPLIYFVFLAVKNKEFDLPKSAWWLLGFTLIALLSLTINFDIIPKPSKNFGRVKYFVYGIGGIFVLRAWLKDASDKTKRILVNTFLLSIIAAGVCAMVQRFYLGHDRPKGFTDTMRYAYGSGMLLLTLLSAILHREKLKNWFDYRFGIVAFVIGFLGMYFTYTRGGLLAFLCGLPFVLYFYRPKLGITLGGAAVLIVLTLGGFYLFGNSNSGSRFLINKNNSSDTVRRSQWQAAIIATKERPAFGWGLSNFHSQLKRIKNDYDLDHKSYNDAHSHNLFLEIASGTGLIGLFFFLGWLTTWAIEAFRAGTLSRALVIPFGAAFVVGSQFEVTFDANNASMIFFFYALSVNLTYVKQS